MFSNSASSSIIYIRQPLWLPQASRLPGRDCGWRANHVANARGSATEINHAITAGVTDLIASTAQLRAAGDVVLLPARLCLEIIMLQKVVYR